MARPDVPPHDDGGHGEAGEGHDVEADGVQDPSGGAGVRRRRGVLLVGSIGQTGSARLTGSVSLLDSTGPGSGTGGVDTSIPLVTAAERTAGPLRNVVSHDPFL